MKAKIVETCKQHFQAHISKHRMNIEIMLNNPQSIPEHSDFLETIEQEVQAIAEYMDKLEVMERYFSD